MSNSTAHHYFASCALGWSTAPTRREALDKLVRSQHLDSAFVKRMHKQGVAGVYCWACKVHAPESANYKINFYAPADIETSDGEEHYLTYVTAKATAFTNL